MSQSAKVSSPQRPGRVSTLLAVLALLVVVGLVIAFIVVNGADRPIAGQPVASSGNQSDDNLTTLRNPASGLSYQIPPALWTPQTDDGTDGPVDLRNGARRTAYTCGTPGQMYVRGELGSGTAPAAGPGQVATALAYTAASQYYATGSTNPQVNLDPAQTVTRRTPSGRTVDGAVVRAIATQSADKCLAARGEVLVLVLQLANADAVLMVNGDLAGGPATPAPPGDAELTKILDSATPISG